MLDTPDAGRILIDGVDMSTLSARELTRMRRERIGFVFQEYNLLPVLNAMENVELPLRYQGVPVKERHRRAVEALERVGL